MTTRGWSWYQNLLSSFRIGRWIASNKINSCEREVKTAILQRA